jgi:hypothetical protein
MLIYMANQLYIKLPGPMPNTVREPAGIWVLPASLILWAHNPKLLALACNLTLIIKIN